MRRSRAEQRRRSLNSPWRKFVFGWKDRWARRNPEYAEYEHRKAAWRAANPHATPREYEQAMRKIAQQLGV